MSNRIKVLAALLAVYVFWGGTYLGIRFAVETLPPFLMAGVRFLTAGLAVFSYCLVKGKERPTRAHWRDAGIVAALLLLGGNGLVTWSEQRVPSSIAALLVATVPLWMILLGSTAKDAPRPSRVTLAGILLGFAGIVVLVAPTGAGGRLDLLGIGALLVASCLWSLGSLYSRRARVPASPLLSVSLQMIAGGALMLLAGTLFGEWARVDVARISARSLWGMGYLVLFGSILAYNCYIWVLKHADPVWVSTYAFVNPLVAVFLGWLLANEQLTTRSVWATAIILLAVVIITVDKKR